jgi:hypothetical protein
MTRETRSFIELEDVLGLEVECLRCHTKTFRPVGNIARFPVFCQSCGPETGEWFVNEQDSYRLFLTKFSADLQRLADEIGSELKKRKMMVRLEIRPLVSQTSEQVK